MTMLERIDIATKEIRGINFKLILSVVTTIVLGVWYLAGRLNTIEEKIDIAHLEQVYQHKNDSLQNRNIEYRLDLLERKVLITVNK